MTGSDDVVAERLLPVIDEGRRTATYKLAVLLALIDACAAGAATDGTAAATVHTSDVARHLLRIDFPQVRRGLGAAGDPLHLRQITQQGEAAADAWHDTTQATPPSR